MWGKFIRYHGQLTVGQYCVVVAHVLNYGSYGWDLLHVLYYNDNNLSQSKPIFFSYKAIINYYCLY